MTHHASMGPRFGERGDTVYLWPDADAPDPLQWGRALVSAETQRPEGDRRHDGHASMGPRFGERGDNSSTAGTFAPFLLQWGRALVSAETRDNRDENEQRAEALMGPRLGERGDEPHSATFRMVEFRFNGAALW